MTPCTTFVNGINPFQPRQHPGRVSVLQKTILAGLKDHGPMQPYQLAKVLEITALSAREFLSLLGKKHIVGMRDGVRGPIYFHKEVML